MFPPEYNEVIQPSTTRAVEQGATVLAASDRLARVLTQSYTAQQRAQGKSVWKTPAILPWDGFLNRLWSEWIVGASGACPLLLNRTQELAVWESIIRASPQGSELLQIPEAAQAAMDAWQLIHAYHLPRRGGQFAASEDCTAFFEWASEFERRRDANQWLEQARLPDVIAELLSNAKLPAPQPLYIAGFDELTPQQKAILDAIGPALELSLDGCDATPHCLKLRDNSDELRRSAAWARERLESDPEARIGIIVPDLKRLRPKASRAFTEVLHPAANADSAGKSFHISLGPPLSQSPVVNAALLILELAAGDARLSRMGMFLRSPWVAGAEPERASRALLDAKLRKDGLFHVSIQTVCEKAEACPVLQSALQNVERQIVTLPPAQPPSTWSRTFSRVLNAAGWPGDRALSSQEYQATQAWQKVLSQFATLDRVLAPLDYGEALDRLRHIAQTTAFQFEDEGAPIQIMGLFESSGLRFDHLWVMGLHDEALPGPARPNPFLPIELQRVHGLPHSSPARELEVATMLMRRLVASAPEIVFSYPAQEGDQELGPSPFISAAVIDGRHDGLPYRTAAVLETLSDSVAPPVPADTEQSGGSRLLLDMAACPFRAWAQNRAGARELEEPEIGIGARDRGTAVHLALQRIWEELGNQAALRALTTDERTELVSRHVSTALSTISGLGRSLEQRRLEKLLCEWLEIEKTRWPFSVAGTEHKEPITLAQLKIKTRIDRIDQLEDGRRIILDYKTGEVNFGCWLGDRPDEPQLPLYCSINGDSIAGIAFAQIRAGKLGFRGVAEEAGLLPGLKRMNVPKGVPLCRQIDEWRGILDRLATRFCAGEAEVNPKPNACDFCSLTPLCRVHDD
jgi:ATP-dependent helicase/nuclease subunit B